MQPKVLSLTGQENFGRLLSQRPAGSQGPFSIHLLAADAALPQQVRLGFILPKKMVKRAVWRNQIKRWSRALLAQHRSVESASQGFDMLIRVRGKLSLNAAEPISQARAQLVQAFDLAMQRVRAPGEAAS